MSEGLHTASRHVPKTSRRRVLEQEGPILVAIAVLLCAWLVLALGVG